MPGGCTLLGARPGSKPPLAWFRDCSDYEDVVIVLVLVAAGAVISWRVGHERWGTVGRLVFWVVLAAVVWVLVSVYGPPHPAG